MRRTLIVGKDVEWDGDSDHMNEYDQRIKASKHACLEYGFWCWKNVFEKPEDMGLYIRKKLRDALRRL